MQHLTSDGTDRQSCCAFDLYLARPTSRSDDDRLSSQRAVVRFDLKIAAVPTDPPDAAALHERRTQAARCLEERTSQRERVDVTVGANE
jgi:hypothetical protein